MRELKVWGGRYMYGRNQGRAIVAAYTKKQACEIAKINYYEISHYWSETGNAIELEIAKEVGLWHSDGRMPRASDYTRTA